MAFDFCVNMKDIRPMKKTSDNEFARMIADAGGPTAFTNQLNAWLAGAWRVKRATVNTWVKRGGPPPIRSLEVLACLANRGIGPRGGDLQKTMQNAIALAREIDCENQNANILDGRKRAAA